MGFSKYNVKLFFKSNVKVFSKYNVRVFSKYRYAGFNPSHRATSNYWTETTRQLTFSQVFIVAIVIISIMTKYHHVHY